MSDTADSKAMKIAKLPQEKSTSIGRLPLAEVDMALAACEKTIKTHIETIKVKLNNNAAIPPTVLRELSKGNSQKSRLMMRRIALLIESGDSAVMELLDKLMKVKPARPVGT
ncbi:MAG: hypothetical protein NTX31_14190 [Burkholderiales bacterium]|nr:hypothetical protein [Burkholderiales bacterium]